MRTTQSNQGFRSRAVVSLIGPAILGLLAAGPWTDTLAGTRRSAPDGLKAGPWALAPYFETEWERTDNVLFTNEESELDPDDEINSAVVGIDAALPFRNSLFNLSYEASQVRYKSHNFSLDTDEDFGASLSLNLNDKDVISIRESYYTGFSDIGRVENSEVVFEGKGFSQNRIDLELYRGVNREKGYYVRLTHVNHAFNETDEAQGPNTTRYFFNYEGVDVAMEYRQPLPSYKWLVAYYGFRRFDHSSDESGVEALFRRERSETAQFGIRGLLGKDQPIVLRLGWGHFQYEFPDGSREATDFTGVAAYLDWELKLGGASELQLSLNRRTLPSSSDTYFVNSEFGADFQRDILRDSSFSVGFKIGQNDYGDLTEAECPGRIRKDTNYRVRSEVELRPHDRVAYRIGISHRTRDSNCVIFRNVVGIKDPVRTDIFDYEATELTIGLSLGW